MRSLWRFFLTVILIIGIAGVARGLPENGGFETGNLTGWNYSGDVSIGNSFTIDTHTYYPTEGNYFAKLGPTLDSGVWLDSMFVIDTFDVIIPPKTEMSFWIRVAISGQQDKKFSTALLNDSEDIQTIDFGKVTFNVPEDWCVMIYGVGVSEGGTIFVDNVSGHPCPTCAPIPEPATMFLIGMGLLGLVGMGRSKTIR